MLFLLFEMKYLALAAMFSVKEPWPIAKSLTGLVISLVPLSFNGYQCNANLVTFLVVALGSISHQPYHSQTQAIGK